MANLDTADKRRSATGVFHMFTVPHIPGSHDAGDRMNLTFMYSGIPVWVGAGEYWMPVGMLMGVYRMKKWMGN
jgi:hypothetical protein